MTEESHDQQRAVITGIGVVSPFGAGVEAFWGGLSRGEQPIKPLKRFETGGHRTRLVAGVPEEALVLPDGLVSDLIASKLSRADRLSLVAAQEAWQSAGLGVPGTYPQAGLFFGSTTSGTYEGENAFQALKRGGPERARFRGFAQLPNSAPGEIVARCFGLTGPTEILASACSASGMAIEAALDALRSGEVEIALVGGTDVLCRTSFGGFSALRAVDSEPLRPFRADRKGMVLGEGGALMVLETEQHARERGAKALGFVVGSYSTCDAHHMTAPPPDGEGIVRAMGGALKEAGLAPSQIALVNTHGSGTIQNDLAESEAIGTVFGERAAMLPVTSTKGCVGHCLGACGALEAVATLLCLSRGEVHPTPGPGPVDPATPVDLVLGSPRPIADARYGMSINLAFGGANVALILERGPVGTSHA